MKFRWPKGTCPIPMEARSRGGKNGEHSHKTKNGHSAGARATNHIRSHIRFATYRRDCIYCTRLLTF